jgi:hypothetical protein
LAAATALAPASAQAPQASTETGEIDVSRVWEALRDRDERIRGLEYLVRYETGRKVNEIEDFVWQRCKILSPELLWHEQYHGDASGATGFDESWTIRIATPALCQELLPAARTFRRLHLEHAARVFDPPPVYLVAVAWWPGPEPGPKTGDMPLSVEESAASTVTDPKGAAPWSARRNASGSVTLSRSDLGMEIDVEPSKGYAISRRSFRVQANTVQYDVSDFREIDGVWLPSIVTQTVRGSQGVMFTLRCQALEMRVGRLTERDFERPHLPASMTSALTTDPRPTCSACASSCPAAKSSSRSKPNVSDGGSPRFLRGRNGSPGRARSPPAPAWSGCEQCL